MQEFPLFPKRNCGLTRRHLFLIILKNKYIFFKMKYYNFHCLIIRLNIIKNRSSHYMFFNNIENKILVFENEIL